MTTPGHMLLDRIVPSPTNPRKTFDKAGLQELADSIRKRGVLQPVLLRRLPSWDGTGPDHELIAGERRWRAAKSAGLAEIPAIVREFTDADVLEVQVIENLQREDIHPLEEAEGYEQLLKCAHGDGTPYTVEEIAAKVGKSKSYLYQRLKLTALGKVAREAFRDGDIDASRAFIIARIADHEDQAEAIEWTTGDGGMPGLDELRSFVQRSFLQGLAKPPFDVTALYFSGTTSAQPVGPKCGDCPKRTLAQPHLFEDLQVKGDFCTDTACFQAKTAAHVEREAEKKRAKGHKVLTGEDAKKVFPNDWSEPKGGFVRLEDYCYDSRVAAHGKWSDLLKGLKPEIVYVASQREPGAFVKVIEKKAAFDLLEKAGLLKAPEKAKASGSKSRDSAESELLYKIELAVHKAVREAILADPRGIGGPLFEGVFRVVARELWQDGDVDMEIQDLSAPDGKMDWKAMTEAELLAALVDLAAPSIEFECMTRRMIAQIYGVDAKAIAKQVRAEAKAAEKAAVQPEKPAKAKKATGGQGPDERRAARGLPPKPAAPGVQIVPLIKPLAKDAA